MIKAGKSRLFEYLFSFYNTRLLRKHFYRIYISGEENFPVHAGNKPVLLFANHSNWWDGLAAFYLSWNRWKTDAYVMMEIDQMQKYRFFRRIGAFSVNRNNPREALESVQYAISLLKNSGRVLWIFPQGLMQPNDFRPITFYNGISKIAQSLGDVYLIPVALRYEFLMQQRPELFISIGKPGNFNPILSAKELTSELNAVLMKELDDLRKKVVNSQTEGFKIILHGKQSVNKKFDKIRTEK